MEPKTVSVYAFSPTVRKDGASCPLDPSHPSARAVLTAGALMAPPGFFRHLDGVTAAQRGRTVLLSRGDLRVRMTEGSPVCLAGGERWQLDAAPRRENGLLCLPVESAVKALGLHARTWDLLTVIGSEDELRRLESDGTARTALAQATLGVYNAAAFSRADFAKARESWRRDLCGSRSLNDPAASGMERLLRLRDEESEDLRRRMNRTPDAPALFGTKPPSESSDLTQLYACILRMARPYGTFGCRGCRSRELLDDVVFALDWMYDHMYGAAVLSDESYRSYKTYNWWDWFYGGPGFLLDTLMIIERDIPGALVRKYILPIQFIRTRMRVGLDEAMYMSQVLPGIALALLTEDRALMQSMYLAMDALLQKHETGNCMRSDWCCMTHWLPYNICYGLCNLDRLARLLRILSGTPLAFPCLGTYNLMHMVRFTFAPVLFDGQGINMMNGRAMQGGAAPMAAQVINGLRRVFGLFGEEEDREIRGILARNATPEVRELLIGQGMSAGSPIASHAAVAASLNDGEAGKIPYHLGYMWASGDCAIQHRDSYCFALRMSSERVGGYECINGVNGDAWYTGDGMLYLYTRGRAQYDSPWWQGTDKYHMPGVTADTQERLNCSINYGMEYKNERDFVGGVALDRMYLTAAMDFRSFHCEEDLHVPDEGYGRSLPLHHCTLEGKKAWFFLDRGVLALGCDIRASDGFEVHTTVENRLLPEDGRPVTVDGRALLPTEDLQVFPGAKALHIPGVGGCVLLEPGDLTVRLTRKPQGLFVTCWIDHGADPRGASYAYALYPLADEAETLALAGDPGIEVLSNTPALQAAREEKTGLCGRVFREGGSCLGVSAADPMIVMTRSAADGSLSLAVSEPTQKRGTLELCVEGFRAPGSADPGIEAACVPAGSRLTVSCENAHGRGFTAVFPAAEKT